MTATEYLTAKRTVDDRALDRTVLERFATGLNDRQNPRVLEVGAGTGTMVVRLAEHGLLPDGTTYRAVDRERAHIEAARTHVPEWLSDAGYDVRLDGEELVAERDGRVIRVRFEVTDAFDLDCTVDAVVACAFLDLVALPKGVERLAGYLNDGLLYAPITFDGLTGFVPHHPDDEAITRAYHRHMETREQPGRPDAGRAVLEAVPTAGGELVAVGGSDWVIRPVDGTYPADEELVLDHLLSTVVGAVSELEESNRATERILEWERHRRIQLRDTELTFLAHNLDTLARF